LKFHLAKSLIVVAQYKDKEAKLDTFEVVRPDRVGNADPPDDKFFKDTKATSVPRPWMVERYAFVPDDFFWEKTRLSINYLPNTQLPLQITTDVEDQRNQIISAAALVAKFAVAVAADEPPPAEAGRSQRSLTLPLAVDSSIDLQRDPSSAVWQSFPPPNGQWKFKLVLTVAEKDREAKLLSRKKFFDDHGEKGTATVNLPISACREGRPEFCRDKAAATKGCNQDAYYVRRRRRQPEE
jgi:hypothetical protein